MGTVRVYDGNVTAASGNVSRRFEVQPAVGRFSRPWTVALVAADVLSFSFSAWAAVTLVGFATHMRLDDSRIALSTFVYVLVWLWLFRRLGLYERSFAMTIQDEIYATITAMALGVAPQLVLFTAVPSISSSRLVLVVSLLLSVATVTGVRAVAYRARQIDLVTRERRIALVGAASRVRAAAEELAAEPNMHVVQIPVEDLDLSMAVEDTSLPASFESIAWFSKALRLECDMLILADVPDPRHVPGLLTAAKKWNLQVAFATPRIRAHAYRLVVDTLGHQALIVPRPIRAASSAMKFVKRAFDVTMSASALMLSLPLMAIGAAAIAAAGRPVVARERRIGRDGRAFDLLNFNTEHAVRPLPRLFNVLRGDMSIVGPRPHDEMCAEVLRAYSPRYGERNLVAPGLTGWAQVHVTAPCDDREIAYDLFYVENWGLFLDVYIVVKAIARCAGIVSTRRKTAASSTA